MRTPILIVTSDKWSRDSYVVFEDDDILGGCIPNEWVDSAYNEAHENDDEITREQIASDMEDDFLSDNTDVDEFWAEHGICRAGNGYYKYNDDGTGKWIDEETAFELMPELYEEKKQAWNTEQNAIASSEMVTPRQAGVVDWFGFNDAEKNEMADDATILRRYNGKLYVYEAQLGEPAQWRLLQPRPHMPTGTLPRPDRGVEND